MEEHMSNHHRRQSLTTNTQFPTTAATGGTSTNKRRLGGDGEDQGESAVWKAFERNFEEVQSALDRNRVLIQQVNENHWSRIHENLVENVSLIQETGPARPKCNWCQCTGPHLYEGPPIFITQYHIRPVTKLSIKLSVGPGDCRPKASLTAFCK
ncbi:unnamed protein product [Cuscuta epithymum]|uniref:Protein EARLY FLOWERING 4 domain-containing protein n=1 Tax=Cuscuta epithymum TaxID=186058 RepID=A0AAV0C2F1_9ASTE|nr:unnamed protein product [Cuscuta epithymum]